MQWALLCMKYGQIWSHKLCMYVTKVPLGQYPLYNPFSYHYCYEYGIYVMDGLCKCDTTRPQPCHLSSRKTHSLGAAIIYHTHPWIEILILMVSLSQSSTTWRAIDDRRLSLKAFDERVFTKFRDKKCRIYKFAQQKCRIYPFSRQICRIHTFLCQKSLVP